MYRISNKVCKLDVAGWDGLTTLSVGGEEGNA